MEHKDWELVSIIVPVYNVQDYLRACIDSLLGQTYTNFELLLIDDGSPDESGAVCEEYAQRDSRIKVYHKENGGLSDARNYGIERAGGTYLTFVDSDDCVSPRYLEVLMEMVHRYHTRMACVDCFVTSRMDTALPEGAFESECLPAELVLRRACLHDGCGFSAWGKIYHRRLFETIRYPKGKLYEDLLTTPYLMAQCDRIAVSRKKLYCWVQRPGSIVHHAIGPRDLELLHYLSDFLDFMDETYPAQHEAAVCRCIDDIFATIVHRLVYQEDYLEKIGWILENSRRYWGEGRTNRCLSRGKKIQWRLMNLSPRLYRLAYRAARRVKPSDRSC